MCLNHEAFKSLIILSKLKNCSFMTLTSSAFTKKLSKYSRTLYNSMSFLSLKKEFTRIPLLI